MTFAPRPSGFTLTRGREARHAETALHAPMPEHEKFDPEVRVAMRCTRCGKHAYGPRHLMKEAIQEHWASSCPARHRNTDAPLEARILVPRQ